MVNQTFVMVCIVGTLLSGCVMSDSVVEGEAATAAPPAAQPVAGPSQPNTPSRGNTPSEGVRRAATDKELFGDLIDNHWKKIFPLGGRNVGGPQFFKYIYERLATNHDLFQRYNRFYCGVSGSIVSPNRPKTYDVVKAKGVNGECIYGRYHNCCWPCSCDLMKYARAERVSITFEQDPEQKTRDYYVLTIGDPCYRCEALPCPDLPPEVTTYACQGGATANGLRVKDGRLTNDKDGRLVFALLETLDVDTSTLTVDADLMKICGPRFNASPAELDSMGGMGNIFVNVARVNSDETMKNSVLDLCE